MREAINQFIIKLVFELKVTCFNIFDTICLNLEQFILLNDKSAKLSP